MEGSEVGKTKSMNGKEPIERNSGMNIFRKLKLRTNSMEYLNRLRRQALTDQRNFSMPDDPHRAVPGLEPEWEKARDTVACVNFILREMERGELRERRKALTIRAAGLWIQKFVSAWFAAAKIGLCALGLAVIIGAFGLWPLAAGIGILAAAAVALELKGRG